jgi:dihydrofolate reductase
VSDTTCHMSISLDGFVAGPDQSREDPLGKRGRELHGWHIGDPRANDADKVANEWLMRPRGAYVMGRNMFGPIREPLQQHPARLPRVRLPPANDTVRANLPRPDRDRDH